MINIELKDLYIYIKSLEINKIESDNKYEEKFYQNIERIIEDAKFFQDFLDDRRNAYDTIHLPVSNEYQILEIECMNTIILKIYNNIDALFNHDSVVLKTIEKSILNKVKSIILKPLISMIDDKNILKINNIEFSVDSIVDILFYLISSIFFNVFPEEIRMQWINSEFDKPNQYSKLESFIYTLYIKELIRSYKNNDNSDVDDNTTKSIFKEIDFNKQIAKWSIVKIFNKSDFLEKNTPNFILLLLFGVNSYKRYFDTRKLSNTPLSFDDYMIKLDSVFAKIDDKAFNNSNLFKLNKIGNIEYIRYVENSGKNISKLANELDNIETINEKFIYGFYDWNEDNQINWTFIMNVIIGYFIEKKLEIESNFILDEIFTELSQNDDNEMMNDIILGSVNPIFKNGYKSFFSKEIRKKIIINDFKKYNPKIPGELSEFFDNKLKSFYENEFKKEMIDFLNKYYKDNYNINNYKNDIQNFYMILIDILYSNFKEFKQDQKSLDHFMYAWIYYHDMRGYLLGDKKKNHNAIDYYYMNFFADHKFISPVLSTNYNKKNIISLIKQNIKLDNIDTSKIDTIVFVDNNMLSAADRIKVNHMECSGDILYKIIIVHLKLNAEINPDNKIDYFSQNFQNELCKSLNISKIVQSNGLHFGDDESFPEADYFESFLYDFYLKFGYKEVYKLIKKLFMINCKNFVIAEKIMNNINDEIKDLIIENESILPGDNCLKLLLYYDMAGSLNYPKNEEQKRKIVKKLLNILYDAIISFTIFSKEDKSQRLRLLEAKLNIILDARSCVSCYDEKTYDYLKLFSILEKDGLEIIINHIIKIYEKINEKNNNAEI